MITPVVNRRTIATFRRYVNYERFTVFVRVGDDYHQMRLLICAMLAECGIPSAEHAVLAGLEETPKLSFVPQIREY